ncbi:hypothetical protein B9Z07_01000 [Burkholderia cenocepacia]|uniref:Uncharacterized protein n=1 Tax=Burkholderia cenocepacia TaxID=95486 RepID=A0AAD0N6V4_9BURK|nr:hypothetical protein B9Z07_01000 [Burkholderia cenocepacia]PRE36019.1 hypothetical protein C6P63_15575 [Burkholderia cenocepacia]
MDSKMTSVDMWNRSSNLVDYMDYSTKVNAFSCSMYLSDIAPLCLKDYKFWTRMTLPYLS